MPRRRGDRRDPRAGKKKRISFADHLWLSDGSAVDWPHFARWHYRSHRLGCVRRVILLWHGDEPIGVCVFASPAASLTLRTRYFNLADPRSEVGLRALNEKLWLLQRVVLHPTYRGAGVAAAFVRRACELCPADWVETLTAMGRVNPFFERAGFVRVGTIRKRDGKTGGAFTRRGKAKPDTHPFSEPAYYVRDNRR